MESGEWCVERGEWGGRIEMVGPFDSPTALHLPQKHEHDWLERPKNSDDSATVGVNNHTIHDPRYVHKTENRCTKPNAHLLRRRYDGRDLMPLLTSPGTKSPHDCIFYWKGCTNKSFCGVPEDSPLVNTHDPGLWAVRCGSYKTHFVATNVSCTVHYVPPGSVRACVCHTCLLYTSPSPRDRG